MSFKRELFYFKGPVFHGPSRRVPFGSLIRHDKSFSVSLALLRCSHLSIEPSDPDATQHTHTQTQGHSSLCFCPFTMTGNKCRFESRLAGVAKNSGSSCNRQMIVSAQKENKKSLKCNICKSLHPDVVDSLAF